MTFSYAYKPAGGGEALSKQAKKQAAPSGRWKRVGLIDVKDIRSILRLTHDQGQHLYERISKRVGKSRLSSVAATITPAVSGIVGGTPSIRGAQSRAFFGKYGL